jgi:hypothetical protein
MSDPWTSESLFYRQVNPAWLANGMPSSQAFGPTPKDEDKLSVDDAAKVSAEESWRHFTDQLGLRSVGTWAVSLAEVEEAGDLKVAASPTLVAEDPAKSNPAHCHVDFSQVSTKGQKKRKAQHLAIRATERGCLYQPAE